MRWRQHGGVLVADGSADDGLNLQDADAVVHARLPWSPNRLEQRIGRVDRYGEGSRREAARQYVVTSPDGEDAFLGAWLSLLTGAFGIFSQSVSALQDAIDQGLPAIWAAGVADGPEGLTRLAAPVRTTWPGNARKSTGWTCWSRYTNPGRVPVTSRHPSEHWKRDGATSSPRSWGTQVTEAEDSASPISAKARDNSSWTSRGDHRPTAGPAHLRQGRQRARPAVMEGGFNRTPAIAHSRDPLIPLREPVIDMLASTVAIDDRGQASVFRRRDRNVRGGPEVYFGWISWWKPTPTQPWVDRRGPGNAACGPPAGRPHIRALHEPRLGARWRGQGRR